MTRKFDEPYYEKLAQERGVLWLGPLPENAHLKTNWKCKASHVWDASYSALKSGDGCRLCRNEKAGNNRRIQPAKYAELASKRGWTWLGPAVRSTALKTRWKCESGHDVELDYEHVKRGNACSICSNRIPKTAEDYFSLARHLQINWLGETCVATNTKTLWGCLRGHAWESSYNAVSVSIGCPICISELENDKHHLSNVAQSLGFKWLRFDTASGSKISSWQCGAGHTFNSSAQDLLATPKCGRCNKLSADEKLRFGPSNYHQLAKAKGIDWLDGPIVNTVSKTNWRCPEGHVWLATYSGIKQSGACPDCSKSRKANNKSLLNDFCVILADAKRIRWIGKDVYKKHERTTWECFLGHKWQAVIGDIQRGSGCPECARVASANRARKRPSDYHNLAKQKQITWLGPEVSKTSEKTEWRCEFGHVWLAQYHNISHGSGCPKCSSGRMGKRKYGELAYKQLGLEKGLKWIESEISNASDKTNWVCPFGHLIRSSYTAVRDSNGCAICNSETRKAVFQEKKLAQPPRKRPAKAGQIDSSFIRANGKRNADDYHSLARHRSITWIGPEVPNTHLKTRWKCSCSNLFTASFLKVMQGRGCCPDCSRIAQSIRSRHSPNDYHKLAVQHELVWLGPEVSNNKAKTKWRCSAGHDWLTSYHSIHGGQGCPTCGRESASEKTRLKFEDYEALAKVRGIEWLGPAVPNAVTKTSWRCLKGHRWAAQYNNIYSGSGCPGCMKEKVGSALKKQSGDYEIAAEKLGIEWLGPTVNNSTKKTKWRCKNLHEWLASYSSIRGGHSCPTCAMESGGNLRRLPPKAYEQCASKSGLKWIGPVVPTTNSKTGWECPLRHQWRADYGHINSGRGCPKCGKVAAAKKTQLSAEAYQLIATEKKIIWLGPLGQNTLTPTGWQCEMGHQWISSYKAVKKAACCPECSGLVAGKRTSIPQRQICEMVKGQLNFKVGSYSVDIALISTSEKIAIEYDAWFWHARKSLSDAKRDEYLMKNGWKILRIKSNKDIPDLKTLRDHIGFLKTGAEHAEIFLADWGLGKVWSRPQT